MGRKVQMIVTMSGTRADGRPWPAAGLPLVVEDWEADHLVNGGIARPWHNTEPEPEPEPVEVSYSPETGVLDTSPVVMPEEPGEAPKPVHPKADWVAWAVAHGADEDEANGLTKAELMERYGERA